MMHSTVTTLEDAGWTYEEIKTTLGISPNEAFDRYFRTSGKKAKDLYRETVPGKKWETIGRRFGESPKNANILKFRE